MTSSRKLWPSPQTMDSAPNNTRWRMGLRIRLMGWIALALAPIFALVAIQALVKVRETQAEGETALVSTTRLFAHDQSNLIAGVRDLMELVREVPAVNDNTPGCSLFLASVRDSADALTNIAIVDTDGHLYCSAMGEAIGLNLRNFDWFGEIMAGDDLSIGQARLGTASGENVLAMAIPMHNGDELTGAIVASVRIAFLEQLGLEGHSGTRRIAGLVDRSGRVITQRADLNVGNISAEHLARVAEAGIYTFRSESDDGEMRMLAMARVSGDDIFALLAEPAIPAFAWQNIDITATIVLPVLMWTMTLIVVWIASDYLVLRWLQYLRRFARLYGAGRFHMFPVQASKAPPEIGELADAMAAMAQKIGARDDELISAIEQKQTLVREVHHRVKNNLQIITSLINLQLSRVKNHESGRPLREAQSRINALAMVHRNLHEAENLTRIEISPFIEELATLTHEASTGGEYPVHLDFDSSLGHVELTTDEAVPLSMFVTEAMTNAYKHAFRQTAEGQTLRVTLTLLQGEDGEPLMSVVIADNGPGLDSQETYKGVGTSLFDAFATQLHGSAQRGNNKDGGAFVSLVFPVHPPESSSDTGKPASG